jgi:hypothetical protein
MSENVNDIRNWGVRDPSPDDPLDQVYPISKRAHALISRNTAQRVLRTNFLQIAGTVPMLKGMEYHRDRFLDIIGRLASGASEDHQPLRHEAVAYVNRAGQFYYFAISSLVKGKPGRPPIPNLENLIHFRKKHTAHRSIDKPLDSDTAPLQAYQAMAMSDYFLLFHPRQGLSADSSTSVWSRSYLVFQINAANGQSYYLNIERDHDSLMLEAYRVLEHVLQ